MDILIKINATHDGLPVAELATVAAWFLWWQRCQLVKGFMIQNPKKTTMSIKVPATNYTRSLTPKLQPRTSNHMWKKHAHSMVKVNVDASFYADTLSGAGELSCVMNSNILSLRHHGSYRMCAMLMLLNFKQ